MKRYDDFLFRLEPDLPDLEQRYRHIRGKLIRFFSWRRCEDPALLADETITRIMKKINEGETIFSKTPYSFVYGVALNVYREYIREKKKQDGVLTSLSVQDISPERQLEQDCRRKCLESLSKEALELVAKYYLSGGDKRETALTWGMSYNALRVQVHRIKKILKNCHENCIKKKLEK